MNHSEIVGEAKRMGFSEEEIKAAIKKLVTLHIKSSFLVMIFRRLRSFN